MKKRFITAALCLLLTMLMLFSTAAYAAQKPISVVSYYCNDGILSVFANISGNHKPSDLSVGVNSSEKQKLKMTVNNSTAKVNYLLLLDASTSMPTYKSSIVSLVKGINKKSKTACYTLAVFGEKFKVVSKNIKSASKLIDAINAVEYTESATDIAGGLCDAIDYASTYNRKINEIYNVVLVTDGIPYLTSYEGDYSSAIKNCAKNIKKKIAAHPEIIVHSVGTDSWDKDIKGAVYTGKGVHLGIASGENAGAKIASSVNGLYILDYEANLSDSVKNVNARLLVSDKKGKDTTVSLKKIPNLDYIGKADEKETEPPTEKKKSENTEKHTNPPETVPETTKNTDKAEKNGESSGDSGFPLWLIIVIAGSALLVAAAVVIILLAAKSKGKNKYDKNYPPINMKLEVLNGNLLTGKDRFILRKELFIGSGSSCDIKFGDIDVSEINARVYQKDGLIYIENLSEVNNTTLGGMKLFAPNRLRSGDEIGVGSSVFVLKF